MPPLVLFALALGPASATAEEAHGGKTVGVGIVLGDPTGLTAKFRITNRNALQLHVGFAFRKAGGRFTGTLDYLFHFWGVIPPLGDAGYLAPYVGVGGRLDVIQDTGSGAIGVAVRVPLGLSFALRGAPVEIFLEVAPGIAIVPETAAIVEGGLGGRLFF